MGQACAWCTLHFRGLRSFVDATKTVFDVLDELLLKPNCMEIRLPESQFVMKFDNSVDGERLFGELEQDDLYPTEKPILDGAVTIVEESDNIFSWEANREDVVSQLEELQAKARQLETSIWVTAWGPSRIRCEGSSASEDVWALRTMLKQHKRYVKVLRVICSSSGPHCDLSYVSFVTDSHVWSHFDSSFDDEQQEWLLKEDLIAAKYNAQHFASVLERIVRSLPCNEYLTDTEASGLPDLLGDVPYAIRETLGELDRWAEQGKGRRKGGRRI